MGECQGAGATQPHGHSHLAEFGGAGAEFLIHALAVEELSRACANTGFICAVHTMSAITIELSGTEEQKNRYLMPLAKGDKLGAFALTEPGAGSDVSSLQTRAVLKENEYVLNGSKCFITNAGQAETYVVFASTDKAKGGSGITAFIVEKGTPGFSFGTIENKVGLRASSNGELVFRDCAIPSENLLGSSGDGMRIALASLDRGRISVAAMGVGIASAALETAKSYVRDRVQFGQPIASMQAIQFKIADMAREIDAARLLTYRAATLADRGLDSRERLRWPSFTPLKPLCEQLWNQCKFLEVIVSRVSIPLRGTCATRRA